MRFVGCALIGLGSVESEFQSYLLGLARGRLEQSTSPVDIARFHLVQSASMLGIIAGIGILIVGLTIINRRAFSLDVQSGRLRGQMPEAGNDLVGNDSMEITPPSTRFLPASTTTSHRIIRTLSFWKIHIVVFSFTRLSPLSTGSDFSSLSGEADRAADSTVYSISISVTSKPKCVDCQLQARSD
jgi:hypothetical protein